jgi:hypothetical protein
MKIYIIQVRKKGKLLKIAIEDENMCNALVRAKNIKNVTLDDVVCIGIV